jgi:NAD+ synthase
MSIRPMVFLRRLDPWSVVQAGGSILRKGGIMISRRQSPRRRRVNQPLVKRVLPYFPGIPKSLPLVPIRYKRPISDRLVQQLQFFIRRSVESHRTGSFRGIVVGLSGGVDSTTVALLCKRAIGRNRLTAVIVDLGARGHARQTTEAVSVAQEIRVPYHVLRDHSIVPSLLRAAPRRGPFSEVNAVTRAIQGLIFQYADSKMYAVASCVDRSEELLSRHMEYFYGHIAPLAPFYKTEVLDLARKIGVPSRVLEMEPGCVEAWLDERVLGTSYNNIDPILYLLADQKWSPARMIEAFGIDGRWLYRVVKRMDQRKWRMVTAVPKL